AHGVVDTEQTSAFTNYQVGTFAAFNRSMSQTFATVEDGGIETIQLNLGNASAHPVGPLVLQLQHVTNGLPDGTIIATAAVNATVARNGGWVDFTFSPAVQVAQGQLLAAVLSSPGSTVGQYWDWNGFNGGASDPYAGGQAALSGLANGTGPWVNQSNVDLAFRILMGAAFNE